MQCLGKHGDQAQVTLRLQRMEEVIVWRGISHHRSCDLELFTIDIGIMPSNKRNLTPNPNFVTRDTRQLEHCQKTMQQFK